MKTRFKDFNNCIEVIVKNKWQMIRLKTFDRLLNSGKLKRVESKNTWRFI